MMYVSLLHTTKCKDTLAKHVHLTKNVRACTTGHIQKEKKSNKLLSEALNKTGSSCSEHSTRCGGESGGTKDEHKVFGGQVIRIRRAESKPRRSLLPGCLQTGRTYLRFLLLSDGRPDGDRTNMINLVFMAV